MTKPMLDAEWTDDCGGKKDYDGAIISISSRYWPRGGGFMLLDTSKPDAKWEGGEKRPEIKPSAVSSLLLNRDNGDYTELARQEFEGDSEENVKAQVEKWAQERMDEVVKMFQPKEADHA